MVWQMTSSQAIEHVCRSAVGPPSFLSAVQPLTVLTSSFELRKQVAQCLGPPPSSAARTVTGAVSVAGTDPRRTVLLECASPSRMSFMSFARLSRVNQIDTFIRIQSYRVETTAPWAGPYQDGAAFFFPGKPSSQLYGLHLLRLHVRVLSRLVYTAWRPKWGLPICLSVVSVLRRSPTKRILSWGCADRWACRLRTVVSAQTEVARGVIQETPSNSRVSAIDTLKSEGRLLFWSAMSFMAQEVLAAVLAGSRPQKVYSPHRRRSVKSACFHM